MRHKKSSTDLTTRLLQNSQKLSLSQKRQLGSKELSYWANEFVTLEHGLRFSFANYPYLIQPYQDEHEKQVHIKSTQMGLSTFSSLKVIHGCLYKYPLGAMYFFPTDSDVSDFSRGRITPLIDKNPDSIGRFMDDTDTVGLKRVGNAFIYFRGMKSKVGMKSVPADIVIFDELDEAPPESQTMARKRMSASSFKHEIDLSNPTIPGYGIDLEFQNSDQKYWMLKCPHCGEWNCVTETFPDCLLRTGDTVILACSKCRRELDKAAGAWVPKYRNNLEASGYQYSQLFSPTVRAKDIWNEYKMALARGKISLFMNLTIGLAHVTAKEKLTKEQVLAMCNPAFPADPWKVNRNPVYMGVDQGNALHVVYMKQATNGNTLLWFEEYTDFEDLDKVMANVAVCVIDALPETRKAREFASRNRGKVFLNYYNANQKGEAKWIEDYEKDEWRVEENRTESMDACHLRLVSGTVVLPARNEAAEDFANHCANTAKKLDEDIETGSKRYIWVKLGPDHYRHAANYANIAMQQHQPIEKMSDVKKDIEEMPDAVTANQFY